MEIKNLGWLDTNIFVTVLFKNDPNRRRCLEIVEGLETGELEGWLDVIVVHELTYVLSRINVFGKRAEVFEYIYGIIQMEGVRAVDKAEVIEILMMWKDGHSFADARMMVLARKSGMAVCSVNVKDFSVENSF